jgi:hypothetical protein
LGYQGIKVNFWSTTANKNIPWNFRKLQRTKKSIPWLKIYIIIWPAVLFSHGQEVAIVTVIANTRKVVTNKNF